MELRHLRYFVAVAEEAHFGRAAKRLQIAQPPLSRQIQALEDEIGVFLFDRSRKRVELTAAGASLLESARRLFAQVDVAIRDAKRASAGESGRITIGYPSTLAYSGLPELLRTFRTQKPGVEISLRELPPQEQMNLLRDGQLDIGFVRAPVEDGSLVSERVRREPLVVALPSDHRLTSRKRIALKDLATENFVCFPRARGPGFFDQLMGIFQGAGFTPRIVQETPLLDLVSFVAAGFGVAVVPASIRNLRRAGVAYRPIVGSPTTDLLLVWKEERHDPLVSAFVEVVRRVGVKGRKRRAASSGERVE